MPRVLAWGLVVALGWGVYSVSTRTNALNPFVSLPGGSAVVNSLPPLPPGCKDNKECEQ
jgi:hypothetical protein